MADRVPLIVNQASSQIQELPVGDNLSLFGSSLVNADIVNGDNLGIGITSPETGLVAQIVGGFKIGNVGVGYTFPQTAGTAGQSLVLNAVGTGLTFATVSGGGGSVTPGGINGSVQFNSGGTALGGDSIFTYNSGTNTISCTNITATTMTATNYNTPSDKTLKKNVTVIKDCLNKVTKLRGVSFDWKSNNTKGVGVIAQEVEQVLPEIITEVGGKKHLNYDSLIALLIESIKDLNNEVNALKQSIIK